MVGEVVSELHVRTSEYIPLFCVPLPGKHNPLIVVPIENSLIAFRTQIFSSYYRGLEVIGVEDDTLVKLLKGFYEFLNGEFEIAYGIRVTIERSAVHKGFLYIAITNSIVRLLSGKLGREELDLLNLIDSELGLNDCIIGLRIYEAIKKPYIWRRGNEVLELTKDVKFHLNTILKSYKVSFTSVIENSDIVNLITRLSGLLMIEVYRILDNADLPRLSRYVNLLNGLLLGLFHELHHEAIMECVDNYDNVISTYVTDIDRVMQVCVRVGS